jgi:hypothetical protein
VDGYAWYMIDGIKCFVSDIKHTISRGNAMTSLTIAGVYDNSINTNKMVSTAKSTVPNQEKSFRQDLDGKAKGDTSQIKRDTEIGENPIEIPTGDITIENINDVLSYTEDNDTTIAGLPSHSALTLSLPKKRIFDE